MSSSNDQLNIRVDVELKHAFIELAKVNGTSATALLVGYMKQYLGIKSDRPDKIDITFVERDLQERLDTQLAAIKIEVEASLAQSLDNRIAEIRLQYLGELSA